MSKLRERVGDIDCKAEMGTLLPDEYQTQLSDALGDALDALDELGAEAQKIDKVVKSVENRCMAADGPVTPTLKEMTEQELRTIWKACNHILTKHGLDHE